MAGSQMRRDKRSGMTPTRRRRILAHERTHSLLPENQPADATGKLETFILSEPRAYPDKAKGAFNRVAFSAAHVVADARAANDPWLDCTLDWEATLRYREYLWDLGLGVAEAMDTAQRGMGLDWPTSLELIRRAVGGSQGLGGAQRPPGADLLAAAAPTISIPRACAPSTRWSAPTRSRWRRSRRPAAASSSWRAARSPASPSRRPTTSASMPACSAKPRSPSSSTGWARCSTRRLPATGAAPTIWPPCATAVEIINAHAAKVDGVKISLLDKDKEIVMRRQLAKGVRMYTGDDFNYAELIAGDDKGYSDALLGIFDAIAPAASAALGALAAGEAARFHEILAPTVPLSRHIFKAPTRFYKTGVVFMAYLNGLQDHFVMVGGQQSARSIAHLAELFRLADRAGLLRDPDMARRRMVRVLAVHGIA